MFFRRRNIAAEKMKDTAQVGVVYGSIFVGFFKIIFDILAFIFGTKKGRKGLIVVILGILLLFVGFVVWGFSIMKYDEITENKKQQEQLSSSGYYESYDALVFQEGVEYFDFYRHSFGGDDISSATYKNSDIGLTRQEQSVISQNKDVLDRRSIYITIRNCRLTNTKSKVCSDALGAYRSFENIVKNQKNFIKGKKVLADKSSKIEIRFDYGGYGVSVK
ncbi:MAG: hypothetical protein J7J31_00010 [Helicobacteraceae bacterium]|nr:hypothetical protein [Helicobacteraceae bacterium]